MMINARNSVGRRRGSVLPLVAICIVAMLSLVALAIDIGMIAVARNQCQNAADASAMAGVRTINGNDDGNVSNAPVNAIKVANANYVFGTPVTGNPSEDWSNPANKPNAYTYKSGQISVEVGSYAYVFDSANPSKEGFVLKIPRDDTDAYSAVRATVTYQGGLAFARVLGLNTFDTSAQAVAVHRPRDVIIIMDLSGSMRFQSLPARPYNGARTASMNPESVIPVFGHYSDQATAALQGTASIKTGSGEYYDPANLTTTTDSGPPVMEYWFQNDATTNPGAGNRAFTRAPDSQASAPAGDNYLKGTQDTGASYASTVAGIVLAASGDLDFERNGYQAYRGSFQGHTQGPGYWGKTFFVWPPDPRGPSIGKEDANVAANHANNGAKDWRQRFFFKENVTTKALSWLDHNSVLWPTTSSTSFNTRTPSHSTGKVTVVEKGVNVTYNLKINYAAVLEWLTNQDPKPFPARLRAGRIRYYDAYPNYADTTLNNRWWTTASASLSANERFWKGYIDFVLGVRETGAGTYSNTTNNDPTAGTTLSRMIGNAGWFSWGTFKVSQKNDVNAYQTGAINSAAGYAAGTAAGTDLLVKNVTVSTPAAGEFVKIGKDPTIYKLTKVNADGTGKTVSFQVDIATVNALSDNDTIRFYKTIPVYMNYADNPRRPRHQYWFGPMTLVDYLGNYNTGQFWWPGNVPEAQAWACKVGIQTAIDDIKKNHPNDFVGMTFFSNPKYSPTDTGGQHNRAVVPLGRNYQKLKDSLWFPPSTIVGGVTEITPWDADFQNVPRAKGGTCPGMGFMIAYNLLSSSITDLRNYSDPQPLYHGLAGGLGRKGAARLVILESDGAPNVRAFTSLVNAGANSYYPVRIKKPDDITDAANKEFPTGGSYSDSDVFSIVAQICKLETDNPPGYSTSRKRVQVFCLGYGTLFDPANSSDPAQIDGLNFFQMIQFIGNTSTSTDGYNFPDIQRIYGTNTERINRMRQAFTNIMQGGVQVSLIQ
jgi:hypothetical protein